MDFCRWLSEKLDDSLVGPLSAGIPRSVYSAVHLPGHARAGDGDLVFGPTCVPPQAGRWIFWLVTRPGNRSLSRCAPTLPSTKWPLVSLGP